MRHVFRLNLLQMTIDRVLLNISKLRQGHEKSIHSNIHIQKSLIEGRKYVWPRSLYMNVGSLDFNSASFVQNHRRVHSPYFITALRLSQENQTS